MMHAASLGRSPRLQRVHALLRDGSEHSTLEIISAARVCAVNSIVAELRANGLHILCRQIRSPTGERTWLYRLEPEEKTNGQNQQPGGGPPPRT